MTVVVKIADCDRRCPTCFRQSHAFGHIREMALTIIPIKVVARPLWRVLKASAPQNENIQPAIVIEIDKGDAATGRFQNVVLRIGRPINGRLAQPGRGGNVGEASRPRLRIDAAANGFLPVPAERGGDQ